MRTCKVVLGEYPFQHKVMFFDLLQSSVLPEYCTVQYAMLHLTHQLSHPDNSNQKGFTTSLLSLCSDTDSYTVPPMTQAFRLTGAEVGFLEDLRHEN